MSKSRFKKILDDRNVDIFSLSCHQLQLLSEVCLVSSYRSVCLIFFALDFVQSKPRFCYMLPRNSLLESLPSFTKGEMRLAKFWPSSHTRRAVNEQMTVDNKGFCLYCIMFMYIGCPVPSHGVNILFFEVCVKFVRKEDRFLLKK